ncbi:MAG: hypothetical protein KUG78_14280 [Kangiellaceae bacterium]|nr:hypothetical protein [Kangiellaceae bacterium]
MELIKYLNENFYTKQQLLDVAKVTKSEFDDFVKQGVMPCCSYNLKVDVLSDSFFGEHKEVKSIEYFAKGYTSWLGLLQALGNKKEAYSIFSTRYKTQLDHLGEKGFISNDPKVNSAIGSHIETEWEHFIKGVYGLCTKSGLPEDIASKELAILIIDGFINRESLNSSEETELTNAVNLLDLSSSLFAPHERKRSSRHRLIDEVRRKFKLLG